MQPQFFLPACICRTAYCPPPRSCRWRMERFSLWTAAWRAFVRRTCECVVCCSSNLVFCSPRKVWRTLEIVASLNIRSVHGPQHRGREGEVACVRCIRLASRVLRPISFFLIRPNEGHIPHPPPQRAGCCPDKLARYHDALKFRSYLCGRVHAHADAAACVCGVHALPARSWMRRGCHPRRTRSTRSTSSGRLPWATKETKRALQLRMHTCSRNFF
jgi:hypothetical protein